MGKDTISSQELSDYTHINSTQIRRDLSGLRQVRQARRRLQRRLARLADPQDPADLGPAQHRAVRRRQPRPGDRELGHLRRPRLPRRGDLRRRPEADRQEGRQPRGAALRHACATSSRRRTSSSACSRCPAAAAQRTGGRPRRGGREDHLQLLRRAAAGPARRDGPHLEPGRGPALRALLLSDVGDRIRLGLRSPEGVRCRRRSAREVFESSTDFTVGLEEEFALLDPETLVADERVRGAEARGATRDDVLADSVAGELIASEIEIRSGKGERLRRRARAPARAPPRACSRSRRDAGPRARRDRARIRGAPGRSSASSTRRTTGCVEEGLQVRGVAQQHLQQPRARRRPRAPTAPSPSATRCGPCCPCCSPRPPTRPSPRAASAACTRPAPRSSRACSRAAASRTTSAAGTRTRDYVDFLFRDQLDRRAHPDLVERPAAPRLRHGRGADHGRAVARGGVDRAAGARDRLRRAGGARLRRRPAARADARPPDRGEPVARDPVRARRQADRPRRRVEVPAVAAVERLLEWTADARAALGSTRTWRPRADARDGNGAQRQWRRHEAGEPIADIYAATVAETRATYAESGAALRRRAGRRAHEPRTSRPRARTSATSHEHLSEEELRARLEEELRRITVHDVLLQTSSACQPRRAAARAHARHRGHARPRPGAARDRGRAGAAAAARGADAEQVRPCATRSRSFRWPTRSSRERRRLGGGQRPRAASPPRRPRRPSRRAGGSGCPGHRWPRPVIRRRPIHSRPLFGQLGGPSSPGGARCLPAAAPVPPAAA